MNYRHAFHAGNFADVFKHLILTRLLLYLARKATPFRYIDTHAGIGVYDLSSDEAQRTGEWRDGIGRIIAADFPADVRVLTHHYLDIVRGLNPDGGLRLYPGSPVLAAKLLRQTDRIALCELHPQDARTLRAAMRRDERVKVVEIDGYTGLNAFTPPPERRGLALIDPPFEETDEFERVLKALKVAHAKWPTGVYAIWHPFKHPDRVARFLDALVASGIRRVLSVEIQTCAFDPLGPLSGCGMTIVNPTHGLADELEIVLPALTNCLATGEGYAWRVRELVGE